jgi:GT2 family glycosyltransferase
MIGIAITTTPNRKDSLDECLTNIKKNTIGQYELFVHNDINFKGVAYSKNVCLHEMFVNNNCEQVYLFDDDCFPIKRGWNNFLPTRHFLLLNETLHKQTSTVTIGSFWYKVFLECGGVFMSVSKKDFQTVGYFNPKYIGYGYEHAGYSQRICRAGLNPFPYLMPTNLDKFLFAHDYSINKIDASLSEEAKQKNLIHNWSVFCDEKTNSNIYQPL